MRLTDIPNSEYFGGSHLSYENDGMVFYPVADGYLLTAVNDYLPVACVTHSATSPTFNVVYANGTHAEFSTDAALTLEVARVEPVGTI